MFKMGFEYHFKALSAKKVPLDHQEIFLTVCLRINSADQEIKVILVDIEQ